MLFDVQKHFPLPFGYWPKLFVDEHLRVPDHDGDGCAELVNGQREQLGLLMLAGSHDRTVART